MAKGQFKGQSGCLRQLTVKTAYEFMLDDKIMREIKSLASK